MDMRVSSPPMNTLRDCCTCTEGQGVCNGESVVITTKDTREVFLRCAPLEVSGSAREQAEKFYRCLPRKLQECGATLADVLWERIFFRNAAADFDTFAEVRREAYWRAGIPLDRLPAATYIEQPPCRYEQAFELQLHAIVPRGTRSRPHPHAAAKRMGCHRETGGNRRFSPSVHHEYQRARKPGPASPLVPRTVGRDVRQCPADAEKLWDQISPRCCEPGVTWTTSTGTTTNSIFRAMSSSNSTQVHRLPASTGIRAGLYPPGTLCAMDLYALLNPEGAQIEVMHTPTLNEAADYGSAFSRGMKVGLPDKTVLFISGTASVDELGATVHLDDVRRQIERMLLNVQELLRPHGATFADAAQIITYLKWRDELDLFLKIWEEWGLSGLPNTFVEAGVCRPNLLCEMEAIVVVPTK